ncbi:MAG: hypothetical protein GXX96_31865 [Planctomycetaceae bacterium]|nr:hypothetical protein [Planctomycetaceae bacterium]
MKTFRFLLALLPPLLTAATILAGPQPGDVFREYSWRPEGKWQRVTGPETTEPRARAFLPNAVNDIVIDDLGKAVDAKIVTSTWNGAAAEEIGINDRKIVVNVGKNHDLSYDEFPVPLEFIRQGTNTVHTHSTTEHHGIEVQWPGMVLFLRLDEPEPRP